MRGRLSFTTKRKATAARSSVRLSLKRFPKSSGPWKSGIQEIRSEVVGMPNENVEQMMPKFEAAQIFFIARRKLPDDMRHGRGGRH